MATNLSVNAKPFMPPVSGARAPPQQQQQQQQQSYEGVVQGSLRQGTMGPGNSQGGPYSSTSVGASKFGVGGVGGHGYYTAGSLSQSGLSRSSPSPQQQQQQQQQPQQQQQQQTKFSPTAAKLFVGQLPFECTEERLRNLFSAYGTVEHIHILRDTSNRSRGAAFVTYSTVQEADTAIFTLHNRYRMLTNRAIQVSYAKNSPNISPFGTHSALEVHQSYPTNPVPDVAAAGRANMF